MSTTALSNLFGELLADGVVQGSIDDSRGADGLSAYLVDIAKEIDAFEDRLPFVVDRNELGEALCQAAELSHRVQALLGRVGLAATNNNVASENGQRTVGHYVASRTNGQGVPVNRLVRSAKWLRDFPIFESAFGAELTDAHVQHMRKHLDGTFDTHRLLVQDQQFFVDAARCCSFDDFIVVCNYWLAHIEIGRAHV